MANTMWGTNIFRDLRAPFFFLPVHIVQLQTLSKQKFVDIHKRLLKFTTLFTVGN